MDAATFGTPGARPKVLLLEDDSGVRRSLQLLLQARGYEVRAHAAGRSLLADENVEDAVCLVADYRVEDIDGIEVLSRLRTRSWAAPAILITAYPSDDLRERAIQAGYAVVLDKPLRQRALVETVARLATRQSAREE